MSRYPSSAYRKGATAPAPLGPQKRRPRLPFPANDPRGPGKWLTKAAGLPRIAARAVPGLGVGLALYEVFEYIQHIRQLDTTAYAVTKDCGGKSPSRFSSVNTYVCGTQYDASYNIWDNTMYKSPAALEAATPGGFPAQIAEQYETGRNATRVFWKLFRQLDRLAPGNRKAYVHIPLPEPWAPRNWYEPEPVPGVHPRARPFPKPRPWREALPQPGTQPSAPPAALPTARPGRPAPKPKGAPYPVRFSPVAPPLVITPPTIRPGPAGQPSPVRPPVVVIAPGPRPSSPPTYSVVSGGARNRPPGKRVKEQKLNIRMVAGAAWGVINFVTEGLDFLGVLHDSLPDDWKTKKPGKRGLEAKLTPQEKLADLYRHWDEIFDRVDLHTVVANYINNQIEDFAYGQLGQATGKANRNLNQTTGLGGAVKRAGKSHNEKDLETLNPVPELNYDPETGKWGLTWEIFDLDIKQR